MFRNLYNIGIKHGFSCINIRQVPREASGLGFQHLPRDMPNVNALKNHVRSLLLQKKLKTFAPLFHNIFNISLNLRSQITIHLLNVVVRFIVFLNSANLICRGTDISKYSREYCGLRDNESRLYQNLLNIALRCILFQVYNYVYAWIILKGCSFINFILTYGEILLLNLISIVCISQQLIIRDYLSGKMIWASNSQSKYTLVELDVS